MMEVLTLAIWKTSTCLTLPSQPLISMPSAAWILEAMTDDRHLLAPRADDDRFTGSSQMRV